jgi:hypothetical protein
MFFGHFWQNQQTEFLIFLSKNRLMNIDKIYKYPLITLKYSKKLKNVFFSLKKKCYFFTLFKKIIGRIMIKCPKITKKPHGSKFRKICDFMRFSLKRRSLIIYKYLTNHIVKYLFFSKLSISILPYY